MDSIPPLKLCTKCGNQYPATSEYFGKDKARRDGLFPYCRACNFKTVKEWMKKNPERVREQRRQQNRKLSKTAEGKEASRKSNKIYRSKHRERERERKRQWYLENKDKSKAARHRRRASLNGLPKNFTDKDWQRAIEYFGGACAYCGRSADFWTIIVPDHYIALNDPRPDNPGTVVTNIVPSCHAGKDIPAGTPCCNNSKHNSDPIEWLINHFGKRKGEEIQARIEAYFEWAQDQKLQKRRRKP